jgi:dTDP-glucose pyrophosphorylase
MSNKIDVVITMGGLGSRFRKMGYNVPKYMIEAKGKTLFEWSMISLEGYSADVNQYVFIAMKDDNADVEGFINSRCEKMNLQNYHIILLDYLTDGQATTAALAERYWNPENSLLIYNIDTYVEAGEMNSAELKGDGFIPCFQAEGDHWSFVRLDDNGRVAEIKEKKRISNYCTLGAYYFKTCRLYKKLYDEYYGREQELVNGEKYVAPLYDFLLSKGGEIYISDVPSEKVHVLGTPEELQAFLEV